MCISVLSSRPESILFLLDISLYHKKTINFLSTYLLFMPIIISLELNMNIFVCSLNLCLFSTKPIVLFALEAPTNLRDFCASRFWSHWCRIMLSFLSYLYTFFYSVGSCRQSDPTHIILFLNRVFSSFWPYSYNFVSQIVTIFSHQV